MSSIYSSGSGLPAKIFGALLIAGVLTVGGFVVKYGGTISVPDGSVTAPSIRSASSTSDGFYFSRVNHVDITASGTRAAEFTPTSTTIDNTLLSTNFSATNATSTGWLGFSTASGTTMNAGTSAITNLTVQSCTGCSSASSLTATQIAYGSASNVITSSPSMSFVSSTNLAAGTTNVVVLPYVSSTQVFANISTPGAGGFCFSGNSNSTSSCMSMTGVTVSIAAAGAQVATFAQGATTLGSAVTNVTGGLTTLTVAPTLDNLYAIGTSIKRYTNLWLSGSATATSMTIGTAGTAMTQSFTTSTSLDFGNSVAQGTQQLTMAAQGATTAGSFCRMQESTLQARTDETYTCYISAANVASVVRDCNAVAGCGDPAAATVIIRVTD